MPMTESEDWIRSVFKDEISQQCDFALMAFADLEAALARHDMPRVWYSVQAFVASCANISKLLWPNADDAAAERVHGAPLREELGITDASPIKSRKLRNHFEHLDERLDTWAQHSPNHMLVQRNVGDGDISSFIHVSPPLGPKDTAGYLNTATFTVTFQQDEYSLLPMLQAIRELKSVLSPRLGFQHS